MSVCDVHEGIWNGCANLASIFDLIPKGQLITFVVFALIYFGLLAAVLIYFKVEKSRIDKRRKRTPFTKPLMRPAGESTRLEIEKIQSDFDEPLTLIIVFVTVAALVPCISIEFTSKVIAFVMCVGVLIFQLRKFRGAKTLRENYRIGYEGERYVAQSLNCLMRDGHYVFHDLPFDIEGRKFNIDHIVVGASGVYAIETKAKRKPEGQSKAHYNGSEIKFTNAKGNGINDITQIKRNARDLAQLLNERLSKNLFVRPVLLYPGWFVTSDNDEQIIVRNHEKFVSEFGNFETDERALDNATINKIRARLSELLGMPILES